MEDVATHPHDAAGAWRTRHTRWRKIEAALIALAAISFAVVIWDLTVGGFSMRVLGVRISSWEADKPFRNGVVFAVAAFWLHDWRSGHAASWNALERWSGSIAVIAALASATIAIEYGIRAAGGSDAFGYVYQARQWASGHLLWRDPYFELARTFGRGVAPLGYDLALTPGAIVPTYAPGLPIAMAIALRLGGDGAVYAVVPLFAGLAVWLTYLIGARVAGRRAATIAAVLFAFSPIFLFQSVEPLSDVPAATWWLVAWLFALGSGPLTPLAAGLAAGAAILTRPNLVVLAAVLLVVVTARRPRIGRASLFICGLAPACLAVAVLNAVWYGSPLRSGYGPVTTLYEWRNVAPNLRNYAGWLLDLHTPIVLLAFAAPLAARIRHGAAMYAFICLVVLSYLFYAVFDNWTYLRFLLPAIPLLFILTSAVLVSGLERLPLSARGAASFLVCLLLPCWYLVKADRLTVFDIGRAEERYAAVGEFIRHRLAPNAVVITVIQSGSVWLYSGRPTLRWDYIEPERLDSAIDAVRARGYAPYILLEHWEEGEFRARFGRASPTGNVDWPPAIEYYGLSNVRVYSVDDRSRYLSGARILPMVAPIAP
jgi:hypothetical protein